MIKDIYYFSKTEFPNNVDFNKIGIRGKRALELSEIKMPVLPGIIVNSEVALKLEKLDIKDVLENFTKRAEKETGKSFNSNNNPAVFKIVLSPSLEIVSYPSIHTIGLTDNTIAGFEEMAGKHFAYHEYARFLIRGTMNMLARVTTDKEEKSKYNKIISRINNAKNITDYKAVIDTAKTILPKEFFQDAYFQLIFLLKKVSAFLNTEEMDDEDTAIIVQPMVYGNYGKDSYSGKFYTRDIVTGNEVLQGTCFQNTFDDTRGVRDTNINNIESKYKKELDKIAETIECHFKEIREIKFTIEKGNLWIIEQNSVMTKSTQSVIRSLLFLLEKKIVTEEYVIMNVKPHQISEILHPVIDSHSASKLQSIEDGITGAPGAARGRIYFSTERLIEARRKAISKEQEDAFILCLPASYAEDVKAIEVAKGIISSEGGYSAHASVVARQYGKVSLVNTKLRIDTKNNEFTLGNITVKEGDYISLDVPYYGTPSLLLGKAELIEPDPSTSKLMDLLNIINKYIKEFKVLGNADTPKDAAIVKLFGGEGIGLCRTEHMFFSAERINIFREMIMANNIDERKKSLDKLQKIQTKDFYNIFKTMYPYPVTIRLLDAPLHEFLPHTDEEMNDFMNYLKKNNPTLSKSEIDYKIESISEVNPMLGHRGCRIAVTYPEIYEMQISAIFESAYKLQSEKINIKPEIMIPIIMNTEELKFIKYGKKIEGKYIKGIIQIEKEIKAKVKAKKQIDYQIGTMIELPSAAISAGDIAKYSEFFSFGTNDLTQTTHGLSRDDFNVFMPDYSLFDLIDSNPFKILTSAVKELILLASTRGKLTRPDIKIGLCGEHGAEPENIEFLRSIGIDYVSCSSYSIPIAKLAIAQMELSE